MDSESPRLRLSIIGIIVVSLFGTLFARLWYLQIMAAPQFQETAALNSTRDVYDEPPRGRILDRNGKVIVDNRTSLVITANPHKLEESKRKDEILLKVAKELTASGKPTKVKTLERRMNDKQYNPLQPVPIAIDIPDDLQVYLAEREDEFPGIEVKRESVRSYPYGPAAAHVLGYVGRINEDELAAAQGTRDDPKPNPKPYQPDSNIGKDGVEQVFESELRGTPGVRRLEVDSKGRVVREMASTKPVPGNDLELNIDIDIQLNVEKALGEQLDTIRGVYTNSGVARGSAASAVMLDPSDGSVLALTSFPTYDPSEFVNGISNERYDELKGTTAIINRAIGGLYAPGSTFKLVTGYAALHSGLIGATDGYMDGGSYQVGDKTVSNAGGTGHGWVAMPRALTVSSDVFFYHLGDLFWQKRDQYGEAIQSAARDFGFGSHSGIELPGELKGVVPNADSKKALVEAMHGGDPRWYPGDNVNLAVGQGYVLVTPLQIANAYSTLVSGGVHHQPNLARRVLAPGGDPAAPVVVRDFAPRIDYRFDIPPDVYEPIRQGLLGVASSQPDATAGGAFKGFDQTEFPVASKTGTAQVNNKTDTALYVACGPDPRYRYCLSIVMEEAGFGGVVAAPVARRVFEPLSGQQTSEGSKPGIVQGER